MMLGSAEAVKAAVEAGGGVGAVSRLSLRHELRTGSLATLRLKGIDLRRQFFVVQRVENIRRQLARKFLDIANATVHTPS